MITVINYNFIKRESYNGEQLFRDFKNELHLLVTKKVDFIDFIYGYSLTDNKSEKFLSEMQEMTTKEYIEQRFNIKITI